MQGFLRGHNSYRTTNTHKGHVAILLDRQTNSHALLLRSSIHPTIHLPCLRRMPVCLGLPASQHSRNVAPHIQVTRYLQGTITLRDTYLY